MFLIEVLLTFISFAKFRMDLFSFLLTLSRTALT